MGNSLFISFEGPEGAGKTTILKLIAEKCKEQGIEVLTTREPGGSKIAEKIRSIILDPEHTEMDSRTEALLYAAARSQHFAEKIAPALASGKFVLCDRFIDSSLAYQGVGRNLGIDAVHDINVFAIGDQMPDFTILFDLEPEVGLARINANSGREINRLDVESLAFHQSVREAYLQLAKKYPNRIRVVDASKNVDEVVHEVWGILQTYM
ncbi:thymidylate kinase [Kurthia zopfii]|uniref:Thymidylate kinase n=1 Tax=Kurthia zopfii TaxID=1650 RepID=A0A8B4Q801_9BACL|nr:dTMP kinase [Kurthia zopfii]PWI21088.1 dTMP kinase [Kurthia zopfii]TDR32111.1 dTMP kinase [Kurthia zopfii]GEK32379.1 thymidylate kinase [Kurthia zopfii]STX08395.1 Thymidylate kinase [Kurthia zopfii]